MKNRFLLVCISFIMSLPTAYIMAQNPGIPVMYTVHEDKVIPSMQGQYDELSKALKDMLVDNNIREVSYHTSMTDEFSYLYVRPIYQMADLDKNMFETLAEKVGKEKLSTIFKKMDECYYEHGTYMVYLDKDLSYMPAGTQPIEKDLNYRTYYFFHSHAADMDNLEMAAKKLKELDVKKNSKLQYRVYRSGFGVVGNYLMVAISSKDPVHFAEMNAANQIEMGAERTALLNELMKYTSKFEVKNGWIRQDLSYDPTK